jgi:hypothetical protein
VALTVELRDLLSKMHCDKDDDDKNNNNGAVESNFYYWNSPDPSPDLQPILSRFMYVIFYSVLVVESCLLHLGFCTTVYVFFPSCKVCVRSIVAAFSLSRNFHFAWLIQQVGAADTHVSDFVLVTDCPANLCGLMPREYITIGHYRFLPYYFHFLIHYQS